MEKRVNIALCTVMTSTAEPENGCCRSMGVSGTLCVNVPVDHIGDWSSHKGSVVLCTVSQSTALFSAKNYLYHFVFCWLWTVKGHRNIDLNATQVITLGPFLKN